MEKIIIGKATLYLGDCMDGMKATPDGDFCLAIADPPYGIGMSGGNVGYKGDNNLARKEWDKEIPSVEYFAELRRVSSNQIIWGGNYFPLPPTRCFLVWDKGAGFQGRSYAECEQAWTSFDANAKIYHRDPLCNGDYKGKIHPTQKPVPLYRWLLLNYAKPGDTILDTHMGSGSSVIACLERGYSVTAYEIDPEYFEAACRRIEQSQRQLQLAL
jgi:site-specific DNA-methyltransferase (adenine-specific)